MKALRRLLLIATVVGAILGGYVFSVQTASLHAMPARQIAGGCPGITAPC